MGERRSTFSVTVPENKFLTDFTPSFGGLVDPTILDLRPGVVLPFLLDPRVPVRSVGLGHCEWDGCVRVSTSKVPPLKRRN